MPVEVAGLSCVRLAFPSVVDPLADLQLSVSARIEFHIPLLHRAFLSNARRDKNDGVTV
jgi:hypothetical protein